MTIPAPVHDDTLDTVRTWARSSTFHRIMMSRVTDTQETSKHTVSAMLATERLHHAIQDALNDDIDTALLQVVVMEGEAAGADDATNRRSV